jgi:hypothetical protein
MKADPRRLTREDQEFRRKFVAHGKATWRVYLAAVVVALIGLLMEHWIPGISRPIGTAAAAIGGTLITKMRYWRFSWYWVTFGILTILQIPLMIAARPLFDEFKYLFMWIFALVDLAAMGLTIELVAERFGEL